MANGITTIPTLTGGQDALLKQVLERLSTMISEGTGVGPAGVIGAAEEGLTGALAGLSPDFMEQYFRENIAPSMNRTFEEDVIPQLREEMIATGDFWGTSRVDIIEDARQKQAERMQSQMADWMRWGREQGTAALPYVPSIAGVGQGLEMERLGATQPFINTPTQLAIGEPSVDKNLLSALQSAASGGGTSRGGGGAGSTTTGAGIGSQSSSTFGDVYRRNIAASTFPTSTGVGTVDTQPNWLDVVRSGGVATTPSGGTAGEFAPIVADAGELPGIGQGTMFDRPGDGVWQQATGNIQRRKAEFDPNLEWRQGTGTGFGQFRTV